ncbi:MAG: DUF1828 domain-containing protein [Gammaproteobacteria bacterium]
MLEQLNNEKLCEMLCADVSLHQRGEFLMLQTPFTYPDGDGYPLYLSELPSGGIRISDGGHTLMHLSYENDLSKFFVGTRGVLFEHLIRESGILHSEESGEFYIDSSLNDLSQAVFHLGQVLTRVYDITFLNRSRVASTFYEDLKEAIFLIVPEEEVEENYQIASVENASDYPVDFKMTNKSNTDLFLFGLLNRDKVRLTTIFLQYYLQQKVVFDSFLVFENQEEIPRRDLARLTNVGGEMITSLDAKDDFKRKLERRLAA